MWRKSSRLLQRVAIPFLLQTLVLVLRHGVNVGPGSRDPGTRHP